MFLFRREPEKPNYFKIVAVTLGIIAAVAAAGYGAYVFCKKKGLLCRFCKDCDFDEYDDFDDEDFEIDDSDDVDVEVEAEPEKDPAV